VTRRALMMLASWSMLAAAPVAAQEAPAWPQRMFITVDVPFQPLNNDFSESLTFADALRKNENVVFAAGYDATRGVLFDVGAGWRLTRAFGAGLTASWFRHTGSGSFDLKVPNPLVANRPFDMTGSVGGLKRDELGVHLQALYALALSKRARAMLSGGPSVFDTQQDLVRSIEFDTLPGFSGLQFDQALITRVRRTVVGFNAGVDVTWQLASHLGVGTVTRYSRATLRLNPGSESGVSRAIEMRAGGLQVGGGIRVLF